MQRKQYLCLPGSLDSSGLFSCRTACAHVALPFRKHATPQLWKAPAPPPRNPSCRCELGPPEDNPSSQTDTANEVLTGVTEDCCSTDNEKSTNAVSSMENPTKTTNRIIALTSAAAAVGLFLATRGGFSGVTLGELAATALPYEEALSNGRPTVLEFYADWCEVCREMAPDVYKVEQQYKDEVNFVMLNVDNTKWEQELDEFGVEGIPHFAFLDKQGNEEGNIVGRLPKKFLEDNILALSKGEDKLPHSRVVGQFSNPESHQASRMAEPRSHGS